MSANDAGFGISFRRLWLHWGVSDWAIGPSAEGGWIHYYADRNNAYMIEISNSFTGSLQWDEEGGLPVTSKEKTDGHGLSSVRTWFFISCLMLRISWYKFSTCSICNFRLSICVESSRFSNFSSCAGLHPQWRNSCMTICTGWWNIRHGIEGIPR